MRYANQFIFKKFLCTFNKPPAIIHFSSLKSVFFVTQIHKKCLTSTLRVRRNLKFPPVVDTTSRFRPARWHQPPPIFLLLPSPLRLPPCFSCRKKKRSQWTKKSWSQSKIEKCSSAQRLKFQMERSHQFYFSSRSFLTSIRILEMTYNQTWFLNFQAILKSFIEQ